MTIERLSPAPRSGLPARRALGRLARVRRHAVAAAGRAALHAGADHLLQLRGGLRPARLRRQGHAARSASSRATRCTRPRAAATAPRARPRINQIDDPERILYPLKRAGARGGGQVGARHLGRGARRHRRRASARRSSRAARNEVMYHVGRPGHERHMDRVLQAWGIDGHNCHTNVCSASARLGLRAVDAATTGPAPTTRTRASSCCSRPTSRPATTSTRTRSGSSRARWRGAKLAVMDPRLSQHGLAWPTTGCRPSRAARRRCCWPWRASSSTRAWPTATSSSAGSTGASTWPTAQPGAPSAPSTRFVARAAASTTREFTPGVRGGGERRARASAIVEVARGDRRARGAPSPRTSGAAPPAGNLGGWQVARALQFLTVLTGSVGTPGGTLAPRLEQVRAASFWDEPPGAEGLERAALPARVAARHYEMCFLLPHFLKEGRGKLDVYFTRVYNPVWTNPDGMTWMEVLQRRGEGRPARRAHADLERDGAVRRLRAADGPRRRAPRHQEPGDARRALDRLPPAGAARRARAPGRDGSRYTCEANPGEVWEEDEFWIELSWRIDPDGALGIRKLLRVALPRRARRSPSTSTTAGSSRTRCPACPRRRPREGLAPLEYMRRYGAFLVEDGVHELHERPVTRAAGRATRPATGVVAEDGKAVGVEVDGTVVAGFPTPSRKLEIYSPTLRDWGWPEHALPGYIAQPRPPRGARRAGAARWCCCRPSACRR